MRSPLKDVLLRWHRDRLANRYVGVEYLDDYWAIVAFTDGYFEALEGVADPGWEAFKAWLVREGIVEGSEGWRLAIPRLAATVGRSASDLLFELMERFELEAHFRP